MQVDDSSQLADAYDSIGRNVGDVCTTREGLHVMFTGTVEFDVSEQYDSIIPLAVECGVENFTR